MDGGSALSRLATDDVIRRPAGLAAEAVRGRELLDECVDGTRMLLTSGSRGARLDLVISRTRLWAPPRGATVH